jgi:hypothetical protein
MSLRPNQAPDAAEKPLASRLDFAALLIIASAIFPLAAIAGWIFNIPMRKQRA